jgi:DNA modification methylase
MVMLFGVESFDTSRGDLVLDPFPGSGTAVIAAERSGRQYYGLELDPLYVDAIIRRWQRQTKLGAVVDTGET